MKAIRINAFGGTEVMKLEDIEIPVPQADEILVKVYASGVNPVDWVIREGSNNFRSFLKIPLTLGWDAAGIVESFGSDVTGFQKGDKVFGLPNFPGDGSYAEYCVGKAEQFYSKPKSLSFNEAAAVPLTALTAWSGMFGSGNLQAGQRILIQGASGGVGSFAVQFAKAHGAYVIGMASTPNMEYLKQLGVDEVIDYTKEKFEDLLHDIDIVLEAAPNRDDNERLKSVKVLKEGGIFVSVNVDHPFDEKLIEAMAKKNIQGALAYNQGRQDWLKEIAQLIDDGKVKVLVSKVYPLNQVADAHRESETWHVRGKLVLEIRKEEGQA